MAASTYGSLIAQARFRFNAAKGNVGDSTYQIDKFWSDDELFGYALQGTTDLWAAIVDLHQEHFLTIDETNVSLASASASLTGVPKDTFRIYLIEALYPATNPVAFVPRPYNHIEFQNARAQTDNAAQFLPTSGVNIFYCLQGAGAPNAAPTVLVAPQVTTAVSLRFCYVPVLSTQTFTKDTICPIPGESDNAIIAWIVSYALGKKADTNTPDPGWLSIYSTEKQSLLTRMSPRQEQDAIMVDGVHDGYWR